MSQSHPVFIPCNETLLVFCHKVSNQLIKLIRLIPEEHVAGVFKELCSGSRDILTNPGASLPVKDKAVSGYTYQSWKLNGRDEISPVEIRVVSHNLNLQKNTENPRVSVWVLP